MQKTRSVGVVGLGLIGGSIAARLSEAGDINVVGVDTNPETLSYALKAGMVHLALTELAPLRACEIVIVAVPAAVTSEVISKVYAHTGDSAIITDVAGVKKEIIKALPSGIRFVGGHPMAGSEEKGIRAAYAHLLENAYYILTPTESTKRADVEAVEGIIKRLGAIPYEMTAEQHDSAVAKISHLPHALAFSLVNYAIDSSHTESLAATGFRDLTRIASSGAELWTGAFSLNSEEVVKSLNGLIDELNALKGNIESGNTAEITEKIQRANGLRERLNILRGAALSFSVEVKDRPGSIARVAGILARQKIGIKNIRVLNSREYSGALMLEFFEEANVGRAKTALQKKGYRII